MPLDAPFRTKTDLDRFPAKIQIQTVNRCNYLCPMCPYPEVTANEDKVQLDDGLFARLIDEVRAAGRRVKLCLMLQNEPLLDRRFTSFLALAHEADDAIESISTVTNGSVLSGELLDTLMAFDRFYLTISVNATERERYRQVHGRDLWDRIHGLLTAWQGRRERIRLSFVLDARSIDDGQTFQRYWRGLGYATRMMPIFARVDTMEVEAPVHAVDEGYGHCHYPVDTLTVRADGGVILCCNDWLHQDQLGNLTESTIAEVWNRSDRRQVREAAIRGTLRAHGMCRRCDYPIRSSQRVRLEALLEDESDVPAAVDGHAVHRSAIRRTPDSEAIPLLVWRVDAQTGTVEAFAKVPREQLPTKAWYAFPIGLRGAFNFGALETVWCPAAIRPAESAGLGVDGATGLSIQLDSTADAFDLFPWYSADWANSNGSAKPSTNVSPDREH